MAILKHHPGMWLRDDLAAMLNAWEDANGVLPITSAGRTQAQQQNFIDLYFYPDGSVRPKSQRPSWLFAPYRPAANGPHVRNGGEAFDVNAGAMRDKLDRDVNAPFYRNLPKSDPVHFVPRPGYSGAVTGGRSRELVLSIQNWLISRGYDLGPRGADGDYGSMTTAAVKLYQQFLKTNYGYTGKIDGDWGNATQAAHAVFYNAVTAPQPTPVGGSAGRLAGLNWQGIADMLRAKYGYQGNDIPGPVMISALQRFLNANGYNAGKVDGWVGDGTIKAVQRWLQKRYGYTGRIDGDFGAGSQAAWNRANAANDAAF